MQYENQSSSPSFINIPQRNVFNQTQPIPFNMNPSSFLNMSLDSRGRSPSNVVMDIGSPPTDPAIKPTKVFVHSGQTTPTTPYQQTHSYIQNSQADKIGSLLSQFLTEESNNTHNTTQQTTPTNYTYQNQQPMQVLSTAPFRTPPMQPQSLSSLETEKLAGKTELEMQLISEQMKQLEQEHLKHLRELEQQQQIASQQYLELLQEYLNKSGCQPPSQEQHQVLMTVLSDPTSLNILKAIFKDDTMSSREVVTLSPLGQGSITEIKTEQSSQQGTNNYRDSSP